jgi:putative transcriptional regulator
MSRPVSIEPDESFLEGKLLIAMPGLIVNKPIDGLSFCKLMEKFSIQVTPSRADTPVLFGGPVQLDRGFVLHSSDYTSSNATLPITSHISLSATTDILEAISQGHGPSKSMLALGYTGWGDGQIESEILANGWIHCDPDPELIFGGDYESKWETAINKLGAAVSGLSAEAGRA